MPRAIPTPRHWRRRPELWAGAALTFCLVLVAWGAWALWTTMAYHRATADETLRDHAAYLSAAYAGSVASYTYLDIRTLLRGAQRALNAPRPLRADSINVLTRKDALNDDVMRLQPIRYFVFDSVTARATSMGDTTDITLVMALQQRLGAERSKEASYFGAPVIRESDTTLAFVEREAEGTRWVGLEIPLTTYRDEVLRPPLEPTLRWFQGLRDSLRAEGADSAGPPIAVSVLGAGDVPLLTLGDVAAAPWQSRRDLYGPLTGTITYAILPPAVPVVMPGGYPPAPGARVAATLALALILLSATGVLSWRAISFSRQREAFTSSISHELRTPLANIQLFAETLLLNRAPDELARRNALDTIVRETRHLGQMVENVLALSRVGRPAHRLSLRPERVDRLILEVGDLFEPLARTHRIALDVQVAPGPIARIDADAVRRILINLIDNAIRHGGDDGKVRVAAQYDARQLRLTVEDAGPGIPADERMHIWQAFERGDGDGSGLGLAVVRQLVELHAGSVQVSDATPHGARFDVFLPLSAD